MNHKNKKWIKNIAVVLCIAIIMLLAFQIIYSFSYSAGTYTYIFLFISMFGILYLWRKNKPNKIYKKYFYILLILWLVLDAFDLLTTYIFINLGSILDETNAMARFVFANFGTGIQSMLMLSMFSIAVMAYTIKKTPKAYSPIIIPGIFIMKFFIIIWNVLGILRIA